MNKFILFLSFIIFSQTGHAINITLKGTKNSYLTNKHVFSGFGCKGENKSPEIKISDIPKSAKSLAITVYDPDAPTGGGWWHWLVFNIPVKTTHIKEGAKNLNKLGATQSLNSFGTKIFGGACPPIGDNPHRYIFTVYALKVEKIDLSNSTTPNTVGYYLNANTVAKATSVALYGR